MQLQLGKRAEAKAAFQKAFEIDPEYDYGGFNLFDLQLEDKEFGPASDTLKKLQLHVHGPWPLVCAVRLGRHHAKGTDPIAAFQKLVEMSGDTAEPLDAAFKALHGSPFFQDLGRILEEMVRKKDTNPAVGAIWSKRRFRLGISKFPKRPAQFFGNDAIALEACIAWLFESADRKEPARVRAFVSHCRDRLRGSSRAWGAAGNAFLSTGQYRRTIRWMADWKSRSDVEPWMLTNLIAALRAQGKFGEAHEICKAAMALPRRDNSFTQFRLMYACEEALAGNMEAASAHIAEVSVRDMGMYWKLLFEVTKGVVRVATAPHLERDALLVEAQSRIYGTLNSTPLSRAHRDSRRLIRRGMKRMAADAHWQWPYRQCLLKCVRWDVLGLLALALVLFGWGVTLGEDAPLPLGISIALLVAGALRAKPR